MATRKKSTNGRRRRTPRTPMTLAQFRERLVARQAEHLAASDAIGTILTWVDSELHRGVK